MNKQHQLLQIAAITPVSLWVSCFRLIRADGAKPAAFFAGQYLNLFYSIDGARTCRPYSIASSPKEALESGWYEVYIHGGGSFTSAWLFRNAFVGMQIESSMPEGEFCLDPAGGLKRVIGISGGMSITPLRAMARAVADGTLDLDLTLFCGWDSREDVLFYEEFRQLADACPRFRAVYFLKDGGAAGFEPGYVDLERIQRYADCRDAAFYLCGPGEMYQALERSLKPLHIPADRYHIELPGEVKAGFPGTGPVLQGETFHLTAHLWGETHQISMRSDETVLVALERAGINAEPRCRSGHCGYCGARKLRGRVFVPDRWSRVRPDGEPEDLIHPCCSFPLSDLEILVE